MVVILSVVLLLACIVMVAVVHVCVVRWTIRRFSNFAAAEDYRNLIKGVTADELEKLPCYEYKRGENGKGSEADCVVCLDGFQVGDRCRLLPICRHSFHANCVDTWLRKTAICPVCRSMVRASTSGSVSGNRWRDLSSGGVESELQEIGEVESGVSVALHGSAAALV